MSRQLFSRSETSIEGICIRIQDEFAAVFSRKPLRALSSAVYNGGLRKTTALINFYVDKGFDHPKPWEFVSQQLLKHGFSQDAVCFLTAVPPKEAVVEEEETSEVRALALVTAGVSNAATAGDYIAQQDWGTINALVVVDARLTLSAMVNAVQTATEAKCAALRRCGVRSYSGDYATGTTTDALCIACTQRERTRRYAGTATALGYCIAKVVRKAVERALRGG